MFKRLINIVKHSWKRLLLTIATTTACFSIPFLTGSFLFDQSAEFMTGVIAKADSEFVVHSLHPTDSDTHFTTKTRKVVTDFQFQISSLGSSVMYYYIDKDSFPTNSENKFKIPLEININEESNVLLNYDRDIPISEQEKLILDENVGDELYQPIVVGSYNALLKNELGFEVVAEMRKQEDYLVDDARRVYDVFISDKMAKRLEEQLGGEYYKEEINEDGDVDYIYNHEKLIEDNIAIPFTFFYGSGVKGDDSYAIISNVITDVDENKYGFSENDEFIFTSYNALFLYRFTHAELRTSLKASEKTTNNYILTNLHRVEKNNKETLKLDSKIYSIKDGKIVEGKVQEKYSTANKFYNSLPSDFIGTILAISIIVGCCVGLLFLEKDFQKKFDKTNEKDSKTVEFIETILTLLVYMIVFFIFKSLSGFTIGSIAINFVNPIVAVISLIQVCIVLVEISYLVSLTSKSKKEEDTSSYYECGGVDNEPKNVVKTSPAKAKKKSLFNFKKPKAKAKQKDDDNDNDSNYFDVSI